jgi:hypothetical protein
LTELVIKDNILCLSDRLLTGWSLVGQHYPAMRMRNLHKNAILEGYRLEAPKLLFHSFILPQTTNVKSDS